MLHVHQNTLGIPKKKKQPRSSTCYGLLTLFYITNKSMFYLAFQRLSTKLLKHIKHCLKINNAQLLSHTSRATPVKITIEYTE